MILYFTLKKCMLLYVWDYIWLTDSWKIGEYETICMKLYILPNILTLLHHFWNLIKEPWSLRGQNSDVETYVLYPLGVDFSQNRPSYVYLILNEWREYSLSTAVNGFHRVGYWKKRASIVWANPLGILYLLYLVYELIDILLNGARPWIFKREIRILVCL